MIKILLLFTAFMGSLLSANAQFTPEYAKSTPAGVVYGFRVDNGSVIVHTPAVKAISGVKPLGIGFELSRQARDSATYHLCSAFPRVGLQFQYFDYGIHILGHGLMASYFIQPVYRLNNHINYFFRASFGASYSDHPFNEDPASDTLNKNYSLRVNPYLQLSYGLGYRVSNHLALDVTGTFDHISNGNWKRPNKGLNWVTAAVSLLYSPSGNTLPKLRRVHDKYWKTRPWGYTIGSLLVTQQGYSGFTAGYQRKYAAGGFVEADKQIGRIHGFVVGVQAYYNDLKLDPPNEYQSVSSQKHSSVLAGLYAGHEFLLGHVIISQVIGLYVTPHYGEYTNLFHQHSLRYLLDKHWQIGFCLKAHADAADFVGLNALYRL